MPTLIQNLDPLPVRRADSLFFSRFRAVFRLFTRELRPIGLLNAREDIGELLAVGGLFWFFLILFFATWAIALWVRPVGPAYRGVYWAIFLAVEIGVAVLLAAATPGISAGVTGRPPEEAPPRVVGDRVPEETRTERMLSKTAAGIGIAFWILLLFFLIAIILGYVFV